MVLCPYCEEYEGDRRAVQAHISSKIDENHKGHVGFDIEIELDGEGETFNCGDCGATVERGQSYCHNCGEELAWKEVTS